MQHARDNLPGSDEATISRGTAIEIQVLGMMRVVQAGRPIDVGGPRQRRLLAALVLADGGSVSVDRLVEAVFGDAATSSATDTLRSYVTRLRRALAPAGDDVVVRDDAGYRLVGDVAVDATRFARLVDVARRHRDRGDDVEAVSTVREALSLWRGPAYGELADEAWVAPEAQRLDESRRAAQEQLADALIAAGRTPDAVGVLRDVLAGDPYREGAVERLMLALYRAGRPADALSAYRTFAARVADDLGIDPGPGLQRVHEQVLDRDPALDATTPGPGLRGYEVRERLGRGRQGTVFAARMPGVDRDYAIRVYDAEIADATGIVATFEADVRLLTTIDEPALLPVYDGWREPGSAALVMRRMAGTLADRLSRGPLPESEARDVVQRTGRGLVALARRGRTHGRVQPSSILTDDSGHAYLCEPPLGHPDEVTSDVAGFLALARACLVDLPPTWWDGLDDGSTDTVAVVSDVLARLDAPSLPPENPYVGLRPFEAADADRYFGREGVVDELLSRVQTEPLVLLVGGSGSGKSSIVRAGLVPRLSRADPAWTTTVMVPGTRPLEHLAQALRRVSTAGATLGLAETARRADGRLLLVVDQLEELFTVSEPDERDRFLALLADAVSGYAGELHVVATVRADFFDHPLDHPVIGGVAARSALAVPPMSPADLEQTILGPAEGRLGVDDGLVSELVTAVAGQPGALPALQFTLRELADRGGSALRRDDLVALGGVDGAIAYRAEQMYGSLDVQGQQTLRRVLQRLVVIDDVGEPSRRTVPRADLIALEPEATTVVDAWVDGRLLTTGRRPDSREPTVTLAHEAVLTRWPRLRDWVDEDRERLLALARLTQSAQEWDDLGRDRAALPRGGRLEQAEQLVRATGAPPVVQEFVTQAQALRTEEHRQTAETAAAEKRTSRRLRRQRWLLAVALVAAIAVGWVAIDQRGAAVAAAEEQRRRADAGASSLVAASNEAALSDWSRALLLAVEAYRVSPSADTERNLLATLVQPRPVPTTVFTSEGSLRSVVVDPTSTWVAVKEVGGPVDVIDLDEGQRVRGAQASGQAGFDLRDGILVFGDLAADLGQVRVLDDSGDRVVATLPSGGEVTDIEISPDGGQVAIGDSSGVVRLLAMDSWEQTAELTGVPGIAIQQLAWADPAQTLHAFDAAGTYLAWELTTSSQDATAVPATVRRSAQARDALSGVDQAVDLDLGVVDLERVRDQGYLSVISTRDGPFWVDVENAEYSYLVGGWLGRPLGGAVTDDGGHVVVNGSSLEVHRPRGEPFDLRGTAVSWSAVDVDVRDDDSAVTVGSDGSVTTWRLPDRSDIAGVSRTPALDDAAGVVVAPDGRLLLRWDEEVAEVLDGTTFTPIAALDLGSSQATVLGAAFVPGGGRVLMHVCPSPPEQPWEPCDSLLTSYRTDGSVVAGPVDAGPARPTTGATVVAGPDVVATVDASGTVTLRDPQTLEPADSARAPDTPDEADSSSLSLSLDGRLLTLTTDQPRSVAVWLLQNGAELLVAEIPGTPGLEAFDSYPEAFGALALTDEAVLVAGRDAFRTYGPEGGEPLAVYPDPIRQGDILASDVVQQSVIGNGIEGLTASPATTTDSSLMLTGLPGSYWLWDPSRPQIVAGPIAVDKAVLDPTGDRLFVWRDDGSAFALSLRPDDLVAAACEAAGRSLTEQEWSRSIGAGEPYDPACAG